MLRPGRGPVALHIYVRFRYYKHICILQCLGCIHIIYIVERDRKLQNEKWGDDYDEEEGRMALGRNLKVLHIYIRF